MEKFSRSLNIECAHLVGGKPNRGRLRNQIGCRKTQIVKPEPVGRPISFKRGMRERQDQDGGFLSPRAVGLDERACQDIKIFWIIARRDDESPGLFVA